MSGRELPDPPAKASKPGGRANPWRRGAWAKGMPGVTPRWGSCLPNSCAAVPVPGHAGTLPATGSHPGKGHPVPPGLGGGEGHFFFPSPTAGPHSVGSSCISRLPGRAGAQRRGNPMQFPRFRH